MFVGKGGRYEKETGMCMRRKGMWYGMFLHVAQLLNAKEYAIT